jgi:hypothetical protein
MGKSASYPAWATIHTSQLATLCAFLAVSAAALQVYQRWHRACAPLSLEGDDSWRDPWIRDWIAEQHFVQAGWGDIRGSKLLAKHGDYVIA